MLQLFRKIRNSLLRKQKFYTYILYTIGEILLVVIGILIALQVNNWNQKRSDRQAEVSYLKKLASNISEDTLNIHDFINKIIFEKTKLDTLTLQLTSLDYNQIDGGLVLYLLSTFKTNPEKSTFENLKFSSNLSILTNEKLADQLIAYYAQWDGTTANWQKSIEDYARHTIAPHIMSRYPLVFQDQPDIHEMASSSVVSRQTAVEDMMLKNFIAYRYSANNATLNVFRSNLAMAEGLLEIIEDELKRFKE